MTDNFKATVIGAGPAGIITVCQLLEHNITPIAWVDPEFNIGGLHRYKDIPSNTKVRIQLEVIKNIGWIQNYSHIAQPDQAFDGLNPEETSPLGNSYEMFRRIQQILDETTKGRVFKFQSHVDKTVIQDEGNIIILQDVELNTKYVFTCTGSERNQSQSVSVNLFKDYPQLSEIDLFLAMSPNACQTEFSEQDTIAVFGNSHSGMLACMNFRQSKCKPKQIYLFGRRETLFAQYLPDGRIKNDSTGLKGLVATWAQKEIVNNQGEGIQVIISENDDYKEYLRTCTKIVIATGFHRSQLPRIDLDGAELVDHKITYAEETGQLKYGATLLPNCYGFGIAFPEKVLDANGSYQHAVGFFKFLKSIRKMVSSLN